MNSKYRLTIKYNSDGRITIPRSIRRLLDLKGGQDFDLTIEGNKIILEPTQVICSICGSSDGVKTIESDNKTVYICESCLGSLRKRFEC